MSSNVLAAPTPPTGPLDDYLLSQYRDLAALEPGQAASFALRRIRYQMDLSIEQGQRAVLDSLRALLALGREEARFVIAAFNTALEHLLRDEKEDVEAMVRDAVYNGLSFYEFERLAELWPAISDW